MTNDIIFDAMALAMGLTAIYTILLVVTAIVSPILATRGLFISMNRLEERILKLETQNAELTAKNIELAMRNNELASSLKRAQSEMIRMQEQIWELQPHDEDTAGGG